MRWRVRAAVALLTVGFLFELGRVAAATAAARRPPGEVPLSVQLDSALAAVKRRHGLPDRGAIGYRDEVFTSIPDVNATGNYYYFVFQYALSPLLVERDGRHGTVLVLTPAGVRVLVGRPVR